MMGRPQATRPFGVRSIAVAALIVVLCARAAAGQERKPAAPARPKKAAADAGAPSTTTAATSGAIPAPISPPISVDSTDAGVVEARTIDGGTRVFKFSELDIEGRLKSPQLVYFLRRMRAEFAARNFGHRSFLREMSETRKESSF